MKAKICPLYYETPCINQNLCVTIWCNFIIELEDVKEIFYLAKINLFTLMYETPSNLKNHNLCIEISLIFPYLNLRISKKILLTFNNYVFCLRWYPTNALLVVIPKDDILRIINFIIKSWRNSSVGWSKVLQRSDCPFFELWNIPDCLISKLWKQGNSW